jgi:hypothetical protein
MRQKTARTLKSPQNGDEPTLHRGSAEIGGISARAPGRHELEPTGTVIDHIELGRLVDVE